MKFTSLFALAALVVPSALGKDLILYYSTHDPEYTGMTSSGIDTSNVKLNDASGKSLRVLGADKFTSPSETMIALSLDQSHVVWVGPPSFL